MHVIESQAKQMDSMRKFDSNPASLLHAFPGDLVPGYGHDRRLVRRQ